MDEYFLPFHVHCCRRGDAYVFLDLKQDDYTLIAGEAAAALNALATGVQTDIATESLKELVNGRLLTTTPTTGRSFSTTCAESIVDSLLDADGLGTEKVTASHVWNFITACTSAALKLRLFRIERTIALVAKRKARRHATGMDMARARQLTSVFQTLRGLFPANYLCLFDSLALIEFLARYDQYPTWVFGIKLEPWAAHCWIQQDHLTFNEGAEEAARFTPIMAI